MNVTVNITNEGQYSLIHCSACGPVGVGTLAPIVLAKEHFATHEVTEIARV